MKSGIVVELPGQRISLDRQKEYEQSRLQTATVSFASR